MKKIWIFGDSFAASESKDSWTTFAGQTVVNKSKNGSSEYRIWKTYQDFKHDIHETDTVIFCHTSSSRIYLKNSESLSSRLLASHPVCDLIFSDVFAKKEIKFIKILKEIWDDDYFQDTYNLLVADLKTVPNSVHLNFFDAGVYNTIWKDNPGKINHMDSTGNNLVKIELLKLL